METMTGRAWMFGDNVLNDGGITTLEATKRGDFDPASLAKECMTGIDPEFPKKAKAGDFIVGGKQFGKGQLHVQGPLGIKGLGVGLISESMPRNFFRLAISAGVRALPFVPNATSQISAGDMLEVNFREGTIRNHTRGTTIKAEPLPPFLWEFIQAGGEREWLSKQYGTGRRAT